MEEKIYKKKFNQTKTLELVETQANQERDFDAENLQITLEVVKDHMEQGIIGGWSTFMAFKNLTSYAISSYNSGLKVIEDDLEIRSEKLPGKRELDGIIYVENLNCYLLYLNNCIYRKDIDDNPAYVFMEGVFSDPISSDSFKYSTLNQRLILPKNGSDIAVVNLERKQIEIQIVRDQLSKIQDLKVFDGSENRICFLAEDGVIEFFSLNFELKKVCSTSRYQVRFLEDRIEVGKSIALCGQAKHLIAGLNNKYDSRSRILVFKINDRSLTQLKILAEWEMRLCSTLGLDFLKQIGTHILWISTFRDSRNFYIYDLNTETGEVKDLDSHRVKHEDYNPRITHDSQGCLCYVGFAGIIRRLRVLI